MNLITDPWIPVRLADGTRTTIRPAGITAQDNPPVALDAPRADFNGALAQFLIGLLQTTFAPRDDDEWIERLEEPPSIEMLDQAFSVHADAFVLDGEGPRFMQDASVMDEKYDLRTIDGLLIETNETHFNKPGRIKHLCRECAAVALFTLQINAPEGGRGHYTSIRGGGPLTTLLKLDESNGTAATLWDHIWLNALPTAHRASENAEAIFPWLTPNRFIKATIGTYVYPEDIPFAHYYWCMPRRILLQAELQPNRSCDLCDNVTDTGYSGYYTRPNGIHYAKEPVWSHPLSPHLLRGKTKDPQVEHPQPGGITYRHWLGYVIGSGKDQDAVINAQNIRHFLTLKTTEEQCIVWAFGYDMKSNKARCWYEANLPLYQVPKKIQERFTLRMKTIVQAAEEVASALQDCIKDALASDQTLKQAKKNKSLQAALKQYQSWIRDSFYQHTETDFYARLPRLIERIPQDQDRSVLAEWHQALQGAALALFDEWTTRGDLAFGDPARVARAHDKLRKQLNSKKLKQILSLPTTREKAA